MCLKAAEGTGANVYRLRHIHDQLLRLVQLLGLLRGNVYLIMFKSVGKAGETL